ASLDQLTTESCRDHLRELWQSANETLVSVTGNAVIEEPQTTVAAAFEASRQVAVAAPEETAIGEFAYAKLPAPGTVAQRTEVEDLGVVQLRFGNHVAVNLKKTDFEAQTIYVKA